MHFITGGFAGAVGADQAEDLAGVDGEADVLDGDQSAKPLGQALNFQQSGDFQQGGDFQESRDFQRCRHSRPPAWRQPAHENRRERTG